jgi:hypothetical protein
MPCKRHGWDNDCVIRDAFYNPQGPRVCFGCNSSITYLFSGKFRCKIQQGMAIHKVLVSALAVIHQLHTSSVESSDARSDKK